MSNLLRFTLTLSMFRFLSSMSTKRCFLKHCLSVVVVFVFLFPCSIDPAKAALLTHHTNQEDRVWIESRQKCKDYYNASVDEEERLDDHDAAQHHDKASDDGLGSGGEENSDEAAKVVNPAAPGQPWPPRSRLTRRNPIVEENCNLHYRDGARDSRHWDVNAAGDPFIQGFARPFSVQPGTTVEFRVRTISKKYRVDIYRLGFYGGKGARLVHSIPADEVSESGLLASDRNASGKDTDQDKSSETNAEDKVAPSSGLQDEDAGKKKARSPKTVHSEYNQPDCAVRHKPTRLVDCRNWHVNAKWDIPVGTSKTKTTQEVKRSSSAQLKGQDADRSGKGPKAAATTLPNIVSGVYIARFVREDAESMPWTTTWRTDASLKNANGLYGNVDFDLRKVVGKTKDLPAEKIVGLAKDAHLAEDDEEANDSATFASDNVLTDHALGLQLMRDYRKKLQRRDVDDASASASEEDGNFSRSAKNLYLPPTTPSLLETALHEPYASLAYFVVRTADEDDSHELYDLVFQTSDTTWLAYNVYDSPNTYGRTPQFNCPHHNFTTWWKTPDDFLGYAKSPFGDDIKMSDKESQQRSSSPVNNSPSAGGSGTLTSTASPSASSSSILTSGTKKNPLELTAHDYRALRKSYNTPLITRDVSLYNSVFSSEYPMIRFLEAQGYAVTYVSGLDTHLGGRGFGRFAAAGRMPSTSRGEQGDHTHNGEDDYVDKGNAKSVVTTGRALPTVGKIFLSVGHDEYWSRQQRQTVERLTAGVQETTAQVRDNTSDESSSRGKGQNTNDTVRHQNKKNVVWHLGFFSGNNVFWTHAWEKSSKYYKSMPRNSYDQAGREAEPIHSTAGEDDGDDDLDILVIEKESQMSKEEFASLKFSSASDAAKREVDASDDHIKNTAASSTKSPSPTTSSTTSKATKPWTGSFRDPRQPDGPYPENALTGLSTAANALRNDPLEVPVEKFGLHAFWRGTEIAELAMKFDKREGAIVSSSAPSKKLDKSASSSSDARRRSNPAGLIATVPLKGILGHEWDVDVDNGHRPPGLVYLSETKIHNVHTLLDYGGILDSTTLTHTMTLHRKQHRAWNDTAMDHGARNSSSPPPSTSSLIFAAGTCQYSWALDSFHDRVTGTRGWENEQSTRVSRDLAAGVTGERNLQQAVVNLFADMGDVQPGTLLTESYEGLRLAVPADRTREKRTSDEKTAEVPAYEIVLDRVMDEVPSSDGQNKSTTSAEPVVATDKLSDKIDESDQYLTLTFTLRKATQDFSSQRAELRTVTSDTTAGEESHPILGAIELRYRYSEDGKRRLFFDNNRRHRLEYHERWRKTENRGRNFFVYHLKSTDLSSLEQGFLEAIVVQGYDDLGYSVGNEKVFTRADLVTRTGSEESGKLQNLHRHEEDEEMRTRAEL
ncbi:unnamed protein product [Amoebophrya sp. A120]|nr:unnamed protein product [Amoebophrya sp. A120]|eukprot:GSA120T00009290001.1